MALRRVLLVSLFSFSLLSLPACKKEKDSKPYNNYEYKAPSVFENVISNNLDFVEKKKLPNGDALSMADLAEPLNLIPALASDSASHNVTRYIYNGLVKYDKNLKLVGDLASKWDISADGREITFYLKENVLWHDGKPFTAEDVRFTYEFMISDDTPTAYDTEFRLVKSFEVIDRYTVKVTYEEPLATALSSWGIWIMPSHALQGKPTRSSLQRNPIGTGPYKLEAWHAGKSIILTAFNNYFEGRPHIEKIFIRVIPNQTTQFLELLNGSIDTMSLTPKQETLDTKNARFEDNYKIYSMLDFSYTYIGYNLKRAPYNIKEFRKALTYAINKQDILDGVLYGKAKIAKGPYKPDTPWFNEKLNDINEYNPELAKSILKDLGFADKNNDGFLEYNGKKFIITLMTNQGNDVRAKIAELVQNAWKQIGIEVKIRPLEWATMLSSLNKGEFEATILGWTTVIDPDQYDIWYSERCGGNGQNFVCFKNEEVDSLLLKGRSTYDLRERKKIYDRFQEILFDEQPYTFLYFPFSHTALSKRFQNIEPSPAGISHNFIDWYVNKGEQKYKLLAE